MAIDAKNVLVGGPDQATTGAILSGGPEAVLPTAPGEAAGDDWEDSGYISEDGLTLTPERSMTGIKDWSGATIKEILEEFNGTLAWAHLETNEAALKNYFGDDNVKVTPATDSTGRIIKASMGATDMPRKPWQFRVKDGKAKVLIVVPDGQVSEQGEVAFTKTNAITWPITLKTFPDADGYNVHIYTDDGVFSA